ncbi:MAG: SDR family oxidoreductase [Bacteroidota bacterium]
MKKKILITGATSGIGLATVERMLQSANKVYAIGRDMKKIEHLIEKYGTENLLYIPFDLTKLQELEALFIQITEDGVKLDSMVHCAGMEETVPLSLYTPEKVKNIFDLNVFSSIELLRVFSKKKYSNDNSSVLFFSSVMGILGQPGKVGYCSTKAAILGVVKSSALELAKRKIRVNAILPGIVNTPMTQKLFSQLNEANVNAIMNMHPLGIGEVEDVVPMVSFLLSDDSRWITGQSIVIDGGYSIQ